MNFYKRTRIITSLFLVALLLAAVFPPSLTDIKASPPAPIWGAKPVLGYFLLTASLAEQLRQEAGLDEAQFSAAVTIARQEVEGLRSLEYSSLAALADPQLSLAEKRRWVTGQGYNRQIAELLKKSDSALVQALGPAAHTRLVNWIERRWSIERKAHGQVAVAGDGGLLNGLQNNTAAGARSFKVYATRFDSNGAYTVAIPDKCIKLANGGAQKCAGYEYGQNYSVRLQYGSGPAVKVTVGESGPWNVDDNFWTTVADPQPRRLFTDLPLGMPESQAAYFDDYNGGLDQFGRQVTSPVAIDLAREVSLDIGLEAGKNDWISVTYLWTEGWATGEVHEVTLNEPTRVQPAYSGDMCGSSWHKIAGFSGSPAYLTLNVQSAGQSTNSAEWVPDLPVDGEYKVEAFIPDHPPVEWQCPTKSIPRDTAKARYSITFSGGQKTVEGNQGPLANGWLDLGTYAFKAGKSGSVKLTDLTGEENLSRTVAFSAVRFVQSSPPAPQPSPTPAPTATPTPLPPDPTLWAGSGSTAPGGSILVPVRALYLRGLPLGNATLEIHYNPLALTPLECQADPGGVFDVESCDLNADRDGLDPDILRINVTSSQGLAGDPMLAQLTFGASGSSGELSLIDILPQTFTSPAGAALPYRVSRGLVCIGPCANLAYFPVLPKLFDWGP